MDDLKHKKFKTLRSLGTKYVILLSTIKKTPKSHYSLFINDRMFGGMRPEKHQLYRQKLYFNIS
jgi:hypothetical protein